MYCVWIIGYSIYSNVSFLMMSILGPLDRLEVNALLDHFPKGTHFTEARHMFFEQFQDKVHFLFRGEATNTETKARVGQFIVHTQGTKNVGRLQTCRRASTAGTDSNVFQCHEQTFSFHIGKGVIQTSHISVFGITILDDFRNAVLNSLFQLVTDFVDPGLIVGHFFLCQFTGGSKANTQRMWECAGSQSTLLSTTRKNGFQSNPRALAHIECPNALWSVDFMATHGHEINLHGIYINGHFPQHLSCIRMKEDFLGTTQFSNLFQRLPCSNLIIDGHDGHHNRIFPHGSFQLCHVNSTSGILDG
mmetsp:Transcript_3222/g.5848  ORF Transcript_3222/g.5848 Transcript_3222/m.5848 type:complete len:304 (+) Transcript_3222:228-1139(+)